MRQTQSHIVRILRTFPTDATIRFFDTDHNNVLCKLREWVRICGQPGTLSKPALSQEVTVTWWGCCRQARVPIFVVGSDVNGNFEVQVGRGGASAGESGSRGVLRCARYTVVLRARYCYV